MAGENVGERRCSDRLTETETETETETVVGCSMADSRGEVRSVRSLVFWFLASIKVHVGQQFWGDLGLEVQVQGP